MQLIFHTLDSLFRFGGIRESLQVKHSRHIRFVTSNIYIFVYGEEAFQVVKRFFKWFFCLFVSFWWNSKLIKGFCSEMEMTQTEGRMEGWLYTIRQNRFGLQFSRKRYFVLLNNTLTSFKTVPTDQNEVCLFLLFHIFSLSCVCSCVMDYV